MQHRSYTPRPANLVASLAQPQIVIQELRVDCTLDGNWTITLERPIKNFVSGRLIAFVRPESNTLHVSSTSFARPSCDEDGHWDEVMVDVPFELSSLPGSPSRRIMVYEGALLDVSAESHVGLDTGTQIPKPVA